MSDNNFCSKCGRSFEEIDEQRWDDDEDDEEENLEEDIFAEEYVDYDTNTTRRKKSVQVSSPTSRTVSPSPQFSAGSSRIQNIARAIKSFEGWVPPTAGMPRGSVSYRNKNPGNLKYVGQREAIGKDERGFAIFPDVDAGQRALERDLDYKFTKHPEWTLEDLMNVYAPSSDNNNPKIYADFIRKQIGE